MSRFSDRIAAGLDRIRQQAGETVFYDNGSGPVVIVAVPLRGNEKDELGNRRVLQADEQDWGVAADDLSNDEGVRFEPEIGHTITYTNSGENLTYALTPSQGEKPYTWSDPGGRTTYRLHSKLIKRT